MNELLKDRYTKQNINELSLNIKKVYPLFKASEFSKHVLDDSWNSLEIKGRMNRIATSLGKFLPKNYQEALSILDKLVDCYPKDYNDFTLMYLPEFVELYGQNNENWDLSINALKKYTKISSSEFAVRPFIIKDEKRMMKQMNKWALDDNEHVRRLASEGCRPLLPWSKTLHNFKKNPYPVIEIIEKLKTDSSLYVRKSVANNLNDISKDHPELVINIAKKWYGTNKNTNWILKHGCRTLLKKGNTEALNIFGFSNENNIEINNFKIINETIHIGDDLQFTFSVISKKNEKVRLEYKIDYLKFNNKLNSKVFQISEMILNANEEKKITKKQSFAIMRTRTLYPGTHYISLIVNGKVLHKKEFILLSH